MRSVEELAAAAGVELDDVARWDWTAVQQSLGGLNLPADYKQVVDGFPDGRFKEVVQVIRPGDDDEASDEYLGTFYSDQLDTLRQWRTGGFGAFPYPLFPEKGGLLPWGFSPMGGLFFWLTEDDDPNAWPVVWADNAYERWHVHRGTMSEFLLRVLADPPAGLAEHAAGDLATNPDFREFGLEAVANRPQEETEESIARAGTDAPELPDETDALLESLGATKAGGAETDWSEVEQLSGVRFPADFRRFLDALGPGVFCDITVTGPQGPDGWNPWELLRAGREWVSGRDIPYVRFFPDPGGIIPWGVGPDGWTIGWQTWAAGPQAWTVVAVNRSASRVDFPELSFSAFLRRYAGLEPGKVASLPGRPLWNGSASFRSARADFEEGDMD